MRVKICGITSPEQGRAIAQLGATTLGFICVSQSPRYVKPEQIRAIVEMLPHCPQTGQLVDRVGVFGSASVEEIVHVVAIAQLNVIQLHGDESPDFCIQVREALPTIELIKAFRVRSIDDLEQSYLYSQWADTLLLDAFHPHLLGGTGKTLDWSSLQQFTPGIPWILAGGLNPENITEALSQLQPDGIDLSSGVEHAPGDKNLDKVAQLFEQLRKFEDKVLL